MLKTLDFDFNLPANLIASQPAKPRDSSKMLVVIGDRILDQTTADLADFLTDGDVLVLNDTKVIKAKLSGKRGDAKVEINLHKNLQAKNPENKDEQANLGSVWQVFAKPAKKLNVGDKFIIADDFSAQVLNKSSDGIIDLEFNVMGENFFLMLEKYGKMPLPPYIKRAEGENEVDNQKDASNYQTIYATNAGAVAAPTAGLHFTQNLFDKLDKKGVKKVFTTLNVGAGTFLPVKSEYLQDHQMHSEYFSINAETCEVINQAKRNGNRVIAVGTTSLRVLESAVNEEGFLEAQARETKIFIYPPYSFKIVDVLMTNFHLPKSTLYMLVSAFIGKAKTDKIYNYAIENQYRFYSFGDCCLLYQDS